MAADRAEKPRLYYSAAADFGHIGTSFWTAIGRPNVAHHLPLGDDFALTVTARRTNPSSRQPDDGGPAKRQKVQAVEKGPKTLTQTQISNQVAHAREHSEQFQTFLRIGADDIKAHIAAVRQNPYAKEELTDGSVMYAKYGNDGESGTIVIDNFSTPSGGTAYPTRNLSKAMEALRRKEEKKRAGTYVPPGNRRRRFK